jgi:hypothetical protein
MGYTLAVPATSVTVASTAVTTLYTAPASPAYVRDLVVSNGGTSAIYLGQGTVSSTQGLPLPSGQSILLSGQTENLYAITGAGTATAFVGLASVVSVT